MNSVTVRAPGKLMLAGEYSVLGPSGEALVLAVHPCIQAAVEPSEHWSICRLDSGQTWSEGQPIPDALSFACSAVSSFQRAENSVAPARVTIQSVDTLDGPKRGYGSSASVTAAVVGALHAARTGEVSKDPVLAVSLRAHREAQDGMGSGTDVAASVLGGLVHWRPALLAGGQAPEAQGCSMRWPGSVHMVAGYSGQSASTREHLRVLRDHSHDHRSQLIEELRGLGDAANRLISAYRIGEAQPILAAVAECHQHLAAWDEKHNFGIVTPDIQRMVSTAELLGVVAKVSGAGGGDSVLAFSDDPDRLDAVTARWVEAGYRPTPIHPHDEGVHIAG